MTVGSWGKDIVFSVSERKILTYQKLSKTSTARFSSHVGIYGKPLREFQGTELEEVSMKVHLNAALGVSINFVVENLKKALYTGKANYLVLGGRRFGNGKYILTKINEDYKKTTINGKFLEVELSLTFVEDSEGGKK